MKLRSLSTLGVVAAIGVAAVATLQWRQGAHMLRPSTALADTGAAGVASDIVQIASLTFAQQDDGRRTAGRPSAPPKQVPSVSPSVETRDAGPRRRANEDIIDRCLQVAREIDPELGRQLAQKRQENPQEFDRTIWQGEVGRGLLSMAQLKQRDPHLYQAKISEVTQSLQINRVAASLQEAMKSSDEGRIKALREQLENLLKLQMAMSLKARGEYLTRIEEQVKTLRAEIEHEAANFHSIIQERMQHLLSHPVECDPALVIPVASPHDAARPR